MLLLLRRSLAALSLFFWQGGFTFYAAVVVPVGTDALGKVGQGFITRRVTDDLNLAGVVALVLLAWELAAAHDPRPARVRARAALWLALTAGLVALYLLHPPLDRLLDPEDQSVLEARRFRQLHRIYLWVSTAQWFCTLAYVPLTLWAWRAEDANAWRKREE